MAEPRRWGDGSESVASGRHARQTVGMGEATAADGRVNGGQGGRDAPGKGWPRDQIHGQDSRMNLDSGSCRVQHCHQPLYVLSPVLYFWQLACPWQGPLAMNERQRPTEVCQSSTWHYFPSTTDLRWLLDANLFNGPRWEAMGPSMENLRDRCGHSELTTHVSERSRGS